MQVLSLPVIWIRRRRRHRNSEFQIL